MHKNENGPPFWGDPFRFRVVLGGNSLLACLLCGLASVDGVEFLVTGTVGSGIPQVFVWRFGDQGVVVECERHSVEALSVVVEYFLEPVSGAPSPETCPR